MAHLLVGAHITLNCAVIKGIGMYLACLVVGANLNTAPWFPDEIAVAIVVIEGVPVMVIPVVVVMVVIAAVAADVAGATAVGERWRTQGAGRQKQGSEARA
jgi:hypothetical protein